LNENGNKCLLKVYGLIATTSSRPTKNFLESHLRGLWRTRFLIYRWS